MMTFTIIAASFLASFLTLFSGFGLGTILMPVAAIFFPIAVAVALTALVHLLNNLFKVAMLWHVIDRSIVFRFGLPAMIAAVPGAWLLGVLSELAPIHTYNIGTVNATVAPIKLTVGILLIFFATAEWLPVFKNIKLSSSALPVGGLLSGFFGGLSGHQGAFRSAFLIRANLSKEQFVASNAAIASLVDLARLAVYGLNIKLVAAQVDAWLLAGATLAAFAGVMAGTVGLKKITVGFIQKLVAAMLYVLGLLLIAGLI